MTRSAILFVASSNWESLETKQGLRIENERVN